MKLIVTLSAQRDLVRLRQFIAKHNPKAARRKSQSLKQSIQRLTDQPNMGIDLEELPSVQDFITKEYTVRYKVTESAVYVLRVWHEKEDR
jgi:plasmid stabilization system protein ParE